MDKDKKIKFKNAAEIVGGGISLGALAAVTMAIEPVFGLIRSGKKLAKQKKENGTITEQDVKNAIKFYGKHLLAPAKLIQVGAKYISKDISTRKQKPRAYTPEELQKSGVADLIKLIEHAPDVKVYDTEIMLGDVQVVYGNKTCKVGVKVPDLQSFYQTLLDFPTIYWDLVEDAAFDRKEQLSEQLDKQQKDTFAAEVAKRVSNNR